MITWPTAYESAAQKPAKKNWLFQFWYDLDSGATITENLDTTETQIDCSSGTIFTIGQQIKIDHEVMLVTSIGLFEIYVTRGYDDSTAAAHTSGATIYHHKFTGAAFQDTVVDDQLYAGIILHPAPRIRTTANLQRFTTTTGSVTVSVLNDKVPEYLSELVYGGSRLYRNRTVRIYSQLNDESDLDNCVLEFEGRLVDVNLGHDIVTLDVLHHLPWAKLKAPAIDSPEGGLFPLIYGSYNPSSSEEGSEEFLDDVRCHPLPVDIVAGESIIAMLAYGDGFGLGEANPTSARLHVYERGLGVLAPLNALDNDTFTYGDGQAIAGNRFLPRSYKFNRLTDLQGLLATYNNDWTTPEDIIEDGSPDAAEYEFVSPPGGWTYKYIVYDIQRPDDMTTRLDNWIRWTVANVNPGSQLARIDISTLHDAPTDGGWTNLLTTVLSGTTPHTSGVLTQIDVETSRIWFRVGINGNTDANFKLYDFYLRADVAANSNEPDLVNVNYSDNLYSGGPGFRSIWDSLTVTEIPGAHRDLLQRICDVPTAKIDTAEFTALESARSGWNIRWWEHEPHLVKEYLDRMQYEGAFLMRRSADGSIGYAYIKDTYTASDVTVLKAIDLQGGRIQLHTRRFSKIITKRSIRYDRKAGEPTKFYSTYEFEDTDARTELGLTDTEENHFKEDLIMLSDGASDYCDAKNIVEGADGIEGSGIIISHPFFKLEIGDEIQFDDDVQVDPFGLDHSDLVFMITKINKVLDYLEIDFEKVGEVT